MFQRVNNKKVDDTPIEIGKTKNVSPPLEGIPYLIGVMVKFWALKGCMRRLRVNLLIVNSENCFRGIFPAWNTSLSVNVRYVAIRPGADRRTRTGKAGYHR